MTVGKLVATLQDSLASGSVREIDEIFIAIEATEDAMLHSAEIDRITLVPILDGRADVRLHSERLRRKLAESRLSESNSTHEPRD